MIKRDWASFTGVRSKSFVRDLVTDAQDVPASDLIDMSTYPHPLYTCVAYAQDELAYDDADNLITISNPVIYSKLPRERRLNKFGLAYRRDAKLYMHKTLAGIIAGAAKHLYETQGWTTIIYDGLRTVDGAFRLYTLAPNSIITSGLLALPGESAHNKGMAVDSMMMDENGREVDMGGHFDHLDMETNSRVYDGALITSIAKKNRLIREAAFLRSAFSQGLLIAPLRPEFWDDRLPENRADLWRVLDSAARCMGITMQGNRKEWERWNYADFLSNWSKTFKTREREAEKLFGEPPAQEKPEFYHGNYHPIYDESLRASGKHLTDL